MHLPTTRRGRYLVYRTRQKNRRARANRNKARPGNGTFWGSGHATRRQHDPSGFETQEPRSYPLIQNHVHLPPYPIGLWAVTPAKGRWGRFPHLPMFPPGAPVPYNPTFPRQFYWFRRVLACPKLRHLPLVPYLHAKEDLPPAAFYQPDAYPSGAPSYRSTLPP